jgi:hypothetical protein
MPAGCVALQTRLLAGFYCDVIQMSKATHLAFLLLSCCALFLLFSAGLELMDTMGSLQEAAYERLCRWGTRGAAAGSCRGPCSPAPPACMPREAHVRPARQLVGWLPFLLRSLLLPLLAACRWVQQECRALSEVDAPEVNPLLQEAAAALRERPVSGRAGWLAGWLAGGSGWLSKETARCWLVQR